MSREVGVAVIDGEEHNYGDVVPDGDRFLMIVSPEEALRVCRDIQIWYYGSFSRMWCRRAIVPTTMRGVFDDIDREHWGKFTFAVEVEPPKPEYVG